MDTYVGWAATRGLAWQFVFPYPQGEFGRLALDHRQLASA